MTDNEKVAFAIGYLRGISPILWSLDKPDAPVAVCTEEAAYYDQQVDVIAKAFERTKEAGE